jgi:hypothetical protein
MQTFVFLCILASLPAQYKEISHISLKPASDCVVNLSKILHRPVVNAGGNSRNDNKLQTFLFFLKLFVETKT